MGTGYFLIHKLDLEMWQPFAAKTQTNNFNELLRSLGLVNSFLELLLLGILELVSDFTQCVGRK